MKQKLIAVFVISVMLITSLPMLFVRAETGLDSDTYISMESNSCPESNILGDVNLDGIVSYRDVFFLDRALNQSIQLTQKQKVNANINMDSKLDIADSMIIFKVVREDSSVKDIICNSNNIVPIGKEIELKIYDDFREDIHLDGNWKSSNENIAKVDKNGKVTMVGKGKVEITSNEKFDDNVVDSIYLYGVENVQQKNGTGIIIGGNDTRDNAKVNLTVNSDGMQNGIAGFSIELRIGQLGGFVKDSDLEITSKTEGWSITERNYKNGILKMTVEVTNEKIKDNLTNSSNVEVEINIPTNKKSAYDWTTVTVNPKTFKRADLYNNTNIPLEDYNMESEGNFGIVINKMEKEGLTVKKEKEDKVRIENGKDIYVKMDGNNNGQKPNAKLSDFFDCFNEDINEDFEEWSFKKDYKSGEEQGSSKNGNANDYTFEGITQITFKESDNKSYTYNVYELGDICLDSSFSININDVLYLRKAIVGLYGTSSPYPDNFRIEVTDVDNSNMSEDRTRNLGDIGDVILIRKRILNNKWD